VNGAQAGRPISKEILMKRKTAVWLSCCALIPLVAVVTACNQRFGNGKIVSQTRSLGAFTAVRSQANLDINITEGAEASVTVKLDENLYESFSVRVVSGVLVVDNLHSQALPSSGSSVDVTVPRIDRVEVNGAGTVRLRDISAGSTLNLSTSDFGGLEYTGTVPSLNVSLDGLGSIKLSGSTNFLTVSADDAGKVDAKDLVATSADLQSNGSGGIRATLGGGTLKMRLTDSGNIEWWGEATVTESSDTGSGSIYHR
jgi:hypothetical protein